MLRYARHWWSSRCTTKLEELRTYFSVILPQLGAGVKPTLPADSIYNVVLLLLHFCIKHTHTHTHTHTPRENNNMQTNKKTYLTLTPSVTVTLPWLGVGPTLPVLTSFWLDHWWDSNSTQDHYELLSWPQFIREFMKKEQVEVVHWCNQDT